MGQQLQLCLAKHCKRSLWKYLNDLPPGRVWFFGAYQSPPSLIHLGTCAILSHNVLMYTQYDQMPNLNFTVHRFLAPCLPILPDMPADVQQHGILDRVYERIL